MDSPLLENIICEYYTSFPHAPRTCRLSMKMNLAEVLTQAEELFYKYCRQNITRGFAEIDF